MQFKITSIKPNGYKLSCRSEMPITGRRFNVLKYKTKLISKYNYKLVKLCYRFTGKK